MMCIRDEDLAWAEIVMNRRTPGIGGRGEPLGGNEWLGRLEEDRVLKRKLCLWK